MEIKILTMEDLNDNLLDYVYKSANNSNKKCTCAPTTMEELRDHLYQIINHHDDFGLIITNNINIQGFMTFCYDPKDKYIQALCGFFDNQESFFYAFDYLKDNYSSHQLDFVYPKENTLMINLLKSMKAKFAEPQIEFIVNKQNLIKQNNKHRIVEISEEYYSKYQAIHNDIDRYWTSDKVIRASHIMKIFIALDNNEVVGYVDITYGRELNEIYDLYVLEEYRQQGYGRALVQTALKAVLNDRNEVQIDCDESNEIAKSLYLSLGGNEKGNSILFTTYL